MLSYGKVEISMLICIVKFWTVTFDKSEGIIERLWNLTINMTAAVVFPARLRRAGVRARSQYKLKMPE